MINVLRLLNHTSAKLGMQKMTFNTTDLEPLPNRLISGILRFLCSKNLSAKTDRVEAVDTKEATPMATATVRTVR